MRQIDQLMLELRALSKANVSGRLINLCPQEIILTTCSFLKVSVRQMRSASRVRALVECRFMIINLCLKHLGMTLKEIAQLINRDHTTVIHGKDAGNDLLETDFNFAMKLKEIENQLEKLTDYPYNPL